MNNTLEALIDEHGLDVVLDNLADICFAKAAHLQTNWQDAKGARDWDKAGEVVNQLCANAKVQEVSK